MTPPHRPTRAVALRAIAADYHDADASAMAVITDHLDALARLLVAHRARRPSKQIRSTNLLERAFVEVRRHTNVIHRPAKPRPQPNLGRARAHQPSPARRRHDPSHVADREHLRRGAQCRD
jgi:hypothetical protein